MKDNIASRISRIITGTAYSMVSKIEGLAPETVLEQAITEVDDALDEVRAELGAFTAQKHHVSKTMARLNHEHADLEEQVMAAYNHGRKDLVESAFARQTDIEDQLPALEGQLGRLAALEKDHNQAVTGLIAKRNEMEDELQEFRLDRAAEIKGKSIAEGGADASLWKAEKAEKAFSRTIRRTTGINRSNLSSNSKESAKLVELANLSRNAKIEAKLRALEERLATENSE